MQPTVTRTHHSQRPERQETEADRELKAFIYQQLTELQPYLIADSQMAVTVQQVAHVPAYELDQQEGPEIPDENALKVGSYVVKFVTTLEDEHNLVAEGSSLNVYEAFESAKLAMMQQLTELQNALIDQAEREEEVESYLNGSRNLH